MEAIMLCYRDLITEVDQTIDEHRKCIANAGSCWWGWWKKPVEELPETVLERAASRTGDVAERAVLLFDCGQRRIHVAGLKSVMVAPTRERVYSPDVARTPAYYSHTKYEVWFEWDAIRGVSEGAQLLRSCKYAAFPSWPNDRYATFIGKDVGAAYDELIANGLRQPFDGTDPTQDPAFQELDEMTVTMWLLDVEPKRIVESLVAE